VKDNYITNGILIVLAFWGLFALLLLVVNDQTVAGSLAHKAIEHGVITLP
jgi:hypothetical protein